MNVYQDAPGVGFELDRGVLRVLLTSPKRRNALRDEAVAAFIDALVAANSDEDVRAVLISGDGDDFCAGADIVARNSVEGPRPRVGAIARRLPAQAHRLIPLLRSIQVPVVSGVRGYAVGIGMQIVLASDFAVVSESVTMWEPFAQRGMGPDSGATWLLPRIVGPVRARELLLLGRRLDGKEAYEWGIAHSVVPDDEVAVAAEALARRLADGPTVALGLSRMLINSGLEKSLADQLGEEAFGMELASRSPDFKEGLSAFVQKRDPDFTGR